jgi:hypothetical protein
VQAGVSFNHQTVELDGEAFEDCTFSACRLVYAGGELPQFDRCRFEDCDWRFEEAAGRTLAYLKLMWGVGAKPSVQAAIKEITIVGR